MSEAVAEAGLRIMATRGPELLPDVPVAQLPALLADPSARVWVDCWGSENAEAQRLAREVFKFHPLSIADCFEKREHPKVEVFEDHLFVITHGVTATSNAVAVDTVELDVFLGQRWLFTYHECPSRAVAAARELCERNHGDPLRRSTAVLLHQILDRQVDNLEPLLDDTEERIQKLEDRVLERPRDSDLSALLTLKRTVLALRRWMTKQREVMMRLARNEFALVPPAEAILFRDVYDHLHRMTDMLEADREMLGSLHETYLSITNLRLGEIMKFLTLFTAVLMPLTVITGIYGMNFEFMPELHERWGYPLTLAVMATVVIGVLVFFRRRGWVGRDRFGGG